MKNKIIVVTPIDTLTSVLIIACRFQNVTVRAVVADKIFEVSCIGDDKGGMEHFQTWARGFIGRSPLPGGIRFEEIAVITPIEEPVEAK